MKLSVVCVLCSSLLHLRSFVLAANVIELKRLIHELRQGINTTTTIYYDFYGNPLLDKLLQNNLVTSIVIREEVQHELRDHFNSQVLCVAFTQSESVFDGKLMNTVKRALTRRRQTDILFITDDEQLRPQAKYRQLLIEWCESNGFFNVLLISTTPPHERQLFQYQAFPRPHLKHTTLAEFLGRRNKWYGLDFHGYPLRVGVFNEPPRAIVYKKRSLNAEEQTIYAGSFYELIKLFIEHHNGSLITQSLPKDLQCFENLKSKLLDLCAFVGVSKINVEYVNSVVTEPVSIFLMVPFARPLEKYKYFMLPFDFWVWISIVLLVFALAGGVSLICWRENGVWDLSGSLLSAFNAVLYTGIELIRTASKSKYAMCVIMLITGFIISNLYLSILPSFLSTRVYERQIDTIDDLIGSNLTILFTEYQKEVLKNFHTLSLLEGQIRIANRSSYLSYRNVLNPNYAYVCSDESCEFLLYQQNTMSRPRVKLLSEKLCFTAGSMPLASEWFLEEAFNDFLLTAYSLGIYDGIKRRVKEQALREGLLNLYRNEEEEDELKPLSLEDFQVALIIFVVGYSSAILVFCMEKVIFYCTQRRSPGQG